MKTVVVVGAGEAAVSLSTSLRRSGFEGAIHVVGDESYPPYHRPPLSKELLRDDVDLEDLWLRDETLYEELGIQLIKGRVVEVQVSERSAPRGIVRLSDGSTLTYDFLVLAHGGKPRRLPGLPESRSALIHYMYDLEDAQRIRDALTRTPQRIGIVGGGFIGLEVAAAAADLGHAVTIMERQPRLLTRSVSSGLADQVLAAHEERGTTVMLDLDVVSVEPTDQGQLCVRLSNAQEVVFDQLVIGIGIEIDPYLAADCGADFDNGVLTDEFGRTSVPGIFAIGDCSRQMTSDGSWSRIESVQNAIEQADRAASVIMGLPAEPRSTPWFWSTQTPYKYQMVGTHRGANTTVVRGDSESGEFGFLHFMDDRLVGAEFVNRPQDFLAVRRILDRGMTLPKSESAELSNRLSKLGYVIDQPSDGRVRC